LQNNITHLLVIVLYFRQADIVLNGNTFTLKPEMLTVQRGSKTVHGKFVSIVLL